MAICKEVENAVFMSGGNTLKNSVQIRKVNVNIGKYLVVSTTTTEVI